MSNKQLSLVDQALVHYGKYGGFSFGGKRPKGVEKINPLPEDVTFPNGAKAAILLTFDVEGNYGNGAGDTRVEIENYEKICSKLLEAKISATFNIVGKMIEDYGDEFVSQMIESGSEVAPHGYVHDMNRRYGGTKLYAGQYGLKENREQIRDGIAVIEKISPGAVKGIRLPYGYFNEYTYQAISEAGLHWTSHLGIEDFQKSENGFGNTPFRVKMGKRVYPMVEIPLDSQTYDWAIWMADEKSNAGFVNAVKIYCKRKNIPFKRSPALAFKIWKQRLIETVENKTVFTFLCHPINLTVRHPDYGDPLEEFMIPFIELLGKFAEEKKVWVCTCNEMARFYNTQIR